LIRKLDLSPYGGHANSVAVRNGVVAVAVEGENPQRKGRVVFFDPSGRFLNSLTVGAMPDMLAFTPDGSRIVVANEGEPNADYTVDPEGSVSIIRMRDNVRTMGDDDVTNVRFRKYNKQREALIAAGVRIFGPGASAAQDFEPEYIAVSPDSTKAFVTLQENNAIARIDIRTGKVEKIMPLGFKDHSIGQPPTNPQEPTLGVINLRSNALDPSDRDGGIKIRNAPIFGMYLPDTIAAYSFGGKTYLVTANEGDVRDYDGFSEEARISTLKLDPTAFPDATELQKPANLGRLKVTNTMGDTDGDGDFDKLFSFGGRSFSIWTDDGELVFDSGDDFEQITADALPKFFNADNGDNNLDSRSDDKGPEPEGLTIGEIDGKMYAFVGLERISGIMVYDISNPVKPDFVQYFNNRNFIADPDTAAAGDIGPEGLVLISPSQSPTGRFALAVANEVSGTVSIYDIEVVPD
jgi:hypothetical protein